MEHKNLTIWKKVFEVRQAIKSIVKDGENPAFRSSYATLAGMMETLQPLFEKNNLLFTSEFTKRDEQPGVMSHLLYLGGTSVESIDVFFPIKEIVDSQKMGAAMTYARRYNLGALFNLTFGEDDDTGDSVVAVKKSAPKPLDI